MKIFCSFILIFILSLQGVLASERIDKILQDDAMASLQQIYLKKLEIKENKRQLDQIEKRLLKAKNNQPVYLKLKKVGGNLIVVGIVVGTYQARFPLGMRFLLEAYFSLSTRSGEGFVKLSPNDIQKIDSEILKIQKRIEVTEKNLDLEVKHFCLEDSRHQLCYANELD